MKTRGRVTLDISATEALILARLVRQAERREARRVNPDFVPERGQRDVHPHNARALGDLKTRILATIDATPDELERSTT